MYAQFHALEKAALTVRVQQAGRKSEMRNAQSRLLQATFAALLTTCAFAASVYARSVSHGSEDPWNAEHISQLPVCTENPISIDWGRESPNVGAQ